MNIRAIVIAAMAILTIGTLIVVSSGDDSTNTASIVGIDRTVQAKDIVLEDNKANIYLFWGDGCAYCEEELEFLRKLQNEHEDKFNVFALEVWSNEENAKLMNDFANELGVEVSGVPFTVVGEDHFTGFSPEIGKDIEKSILETASGDSDLFKRISAE